jgi:DNA-binding transcriptional ArsR family regulator
VIVFRFGRSDLLSIRFALSPVFEVLCGIALLRDPRHHPGHEPWISSARKRTGRLRTPMLDALVNLDGYTPDFFSPPPVMPLPSLHAELSRIAATPPTQINRELEWRFDGETLPQALWSLHDSPPAGLQQLCVEMLAFWEAAIVADWKRMIAIGQADMIYRSRKLAEAGARAVLDDLHPKIRWNDAGLIWERPHDQLVDLHGRGLLLVPTVLSWPGLSGLLDERWQQPALVYPPRGLESFWEPDEHDDQDPLGELLGHRRARILRRLEQPTSTSVLVRQLGYSLGGVSEHLSVLRRAGLAIARRDGQRVLYERNAAGDALVRAADPPRPRRTTEDYLQAANHVTT